MQRLSKLFVVAMIAACSSKAPAPASPTGAADDGQSQSLEEPGELVRVELVADVTRVAPGQELVLATRYVVDPGWHIYWRNPGESGLPTTMELAVPSGFTSGPTRYPGPVRFESPGPVVSYGYSGEVLLSSVITAPEPLPQGEMRFRVSAEWLACRDDACVPGSGTAELVLPAASDTEPSAPANQALVSAHLRGLPRPMSELAGAEHRWQRLRDDLELVIAVPGRAELEFFPTEDSQVGLIGSAVMPGDTSTSLRVTYRSDKAPSTVTGVVAVARAGTRQYYAVELTRPNEI